LASIEVTDLFFKLFYYFIEWTGQFEKYKIHPEEKSNKELAWEYIKVKPFNCLMELPMYWTQFKFINMVTKINMASFDQTPSAPWMILEALFLSACFDFLFFCFHRCCHSKSLYHIHKKHHEMKVTHVYTNDHEHPLESSVQILLKMLPTLLLGTHIYTNCVYNAIVKAFANLQHCGYELPIFRPLQQFPFISSPTAHDYHHYHGYSNYGAILIVWDLAFGTDSQTMARARKNRAAKRKEGQMGPSGVKDVTVLNEH
jgi:sterol desaturase/sphingolipid hydroxylase (fatty acid hydroxylase superfamily)